MAGINQVTPPLLAGCVVSCGAVLAVAGAGKLYRGGRGRGGGTAVQRVLRMPPRRWRRAELAAGALECPAGILVGSGTHPVLGGAGLAALASVFCALLGLHTREAGSRRLRLSQLASGAGDDARDHHVQGPGPERGGYCSAQASRI